MKAPISLGEIILVVVLITFGLLMLKAVRSKPKPKRRAEKKPPLWKRIVFGKDAERWSNPVLPVSGESEHPFWSWVSRSLGGQYEQSQEEYPRGGLSRKELEQIARETLAKERARQPQGQRRQRQQSQPQPPPPIAVKRREKIYCACCGEQIKSGQYYIPNNEGQLWEEDQDLLGQPLCNWCWLNQRVWAKRRSPDCKQRKGKRRR